MSTPSAILAFDGGNTQARLVWMEAGRITRRESWPAHGLAPPLDLGPASEWPLLVSCVTPGRLGCFLETLRAEHSGPVRVIGPDSGWPLEVAYETPETLGADRVVAALGAWVRHPHGAVVINAGTAVTVDWVDEHGVFRGGAIAPGPGAILDALPRVAPALPRVEPDPALGWPGANSAACVGLGVTAILAGGTRALVSQARAVAGSAAPVVLAGGAASLIKGFVEPPVESVPDLVFEGLWAAALRFPW